MASFFRRAGAAIARFFQSAADPAAEANKVLLYAKDVAGTSQLFARTDDGTVNQLTPAGGAVTDQSMDGAGSVGDPLSVRASRVTRFYDDFLNQSQITTSVVAGGAVAMFDGFGLAFGSLELSANGNGDAIAINTCENTVNDIGAPNTSGYIEWRVAFTGAAPAAGADYRVRVGLSSRRAAGGGVDIGTGFMFAASFADFASGNWQATIDGTAGVRTTNTGVAVTGGFNYQTLRAEWSSDGAGVVTTNWFIDDVQVATWNQAGFTPAVAIVAEFENVNNAGGELIVDYADMAIVQDRR